MGLNVSGSFHAEWLDHQIFRTKIKVHRVQNNRDLSANLRDDEREPVATIPPAARLAVARDQPATIVVPVRVKQVGIAVGMCKMPSVPPPFEYSQG